MTAEITCPKSWLSAAFTNQYIFRLMLYLLTWLLWIAICWWRWLFDAGRTIPRRGYDYPAVSTRTTLIATIHVMGEPRLYIVPRARWRGGKEKEKKRRWKLFSVLVYVLVKVSRPSPFVSFTSPSAHETTMVERKRTGKRLDAYQTRRPGNVFAMLSCRVGLGGNYRAY